MIAVLGLDGVDTPERIAGWARQGADEFFAGFMPPAWTERFGWEVCLNRRCFGPPYHYLSLAALDEAIQAVHRAGKRIFLAFNAHQYTGPQLPLLRELMQATDRLGPDGYILADPGVIAALPGWGIDRPICLSTGAAVMNAETVRFYCGLARIRRVIIPRKVTVREVAGLIENLADLNLEFEVMIIGGRCFFNDELCFSWHAGSAGNFCSEFQENKAVVDRRFPPDWKERLRRMLAAPDEQYRADSELDQFHRHLATPDPLAGGRAARRGRPEPPGGMCAALTEQLFLQCGLCLIPAFRRAGVHALKIISRGEDWRKARFLQAVRAVLDHPHPDEAFCQSVIDSREFCARPESCYYHREPER